MIHLIINEAPVVFIFPVTQLILKDDKTTRHKPGADETLNWFTTT